VSEIAGEHRSQGPKRRGRPPSGGREAIIAATLRLLRERGIARLTTRAIARCAGVSEASLFYHYGDRTGLLVAAFEAGVAPLRELKEGGLSGPDRRRVLTRLARALERFLEEVLPVLAAAQADVELRDALGAYMAASDIGPHRGVRVLGAYLAAEQAAGRVRADVDPEAVALAFIGAFTSRAWQRQLHCGKAKLPALAQVVRTFDTLLEPCGSQEPRAREQNGPGAPLRPPQRGS
jgi:AcrR family transcriptional regulator